MVTAAQWPPKGGEYRSLHPRPRHKLPFEPEYPGGAEHAAPDGFHQAPLTAPDKAGTDVVLRLWTRPRAAGGS